MILPRHVALIVDAAKPYDRKIISGVAQYVKEQADWSLYVEEDPLEKLPDLRNVARAAGSSPILTTARWRWPCVG